MRISLIDKEILLIELEHIHESISTAGCPKIYTPIKYIIFKKVPKNFKRVDLAKFCHDIAKSIGVEYETSTIFLTAADISNYSYEVISQNGVKASAIITYGVDNIPCINPTHVNSKIRTSMNTINVAVIVNSPLDHVGLLDLFRVISEVKGALIALGTHMCVRGLSIGTPSDATLVAAPKGKNRFAGIATPVGKAAILAVLNALSKQIKCVNIEDYFAQMLGVKNLKELINIAIKIYAKAKIPKISEKVIISEIRNEFLNLLKDPNLLSFIKGLRLLETILSLNLLPKFNFDEYVKDSSGIIVDELAGKALAEYINGFKGLLAYYWVEQIKRKNMLPPLSSLPPITDDLVTSVIGSILSKIYDKYSRS